MVDTPKYQDLILLSEIYSHILYGQPGKACGGGCSRKCEWKDSGFGSAYQDDVARMPMWKSYLYHLQQQAPKPKRIVSQREISNKPPFYGREYHGAIAREDTDFLLTIGGEGSYLIRESQRAPGQYTLAIRFESTTKNFKLYYDGQHYVGEKRFDTVQDLVADGLITFYLESKAADYIAQLSNQSNYAESPYVAYNTLKKKQLAAPRSGTRSKQRHHHHHHKNTEKKGGEGEGGNQKERSERSPSTGADGNRVSKKTSANIPVESRVSQILENRQDANLNISVSKEAQSSHGVGGGPPSGVGVSAIAPTKNHVRESDAALASQGAQTAAESNRGVTTKPPESTSSDSSKEHHDYANQTQINLHRQSHLEAQARREQEALARKQQQQQHEAGPSNAAGPASTSHNAQAVRHTHIGSPSGSSPDEGDTLDAGRVSSSTNTDGPRQRASVPTRVDIEFQKREILEMKKRHNLKMLEDSHVASPPSSPVPLLDHLKFGNVNWCTDFLEVLGSEKPHNFKQTTFKGPHWCDFCANFLWGLIAQGVKCQDCGFNAHKKCSEKVPNDCMPDMKYVKRMFGVDLTTLVKAQNTLIPAVVEKCVTEIESRGVDSEGLYRVAGFHDDVEAIKMSFDKDGELTDISEERYDDINTITSLLKLYFRLLPIPLITFDVYFSVIDTVKLQNLNHDQKLEQLRSTLQQLPPAHYHTVKYLMAHLHRVSEKQNKNMMSPENLAIVFAPTLLRSPENDPLSGLTAVKFERELIEILISHHSMVLE